MLDYIFTRVLKDTLTPSSFFICALFSVLLGLFLAGTYTIKSRYSKSFVMTLALLPLIVQVVMMLVNGNLGTGIAVMGAFSLVRFRSVPGSAKEILYIFTAMAIGLANGVGHVGVASLFTLIIIALTLAFSFSKLGEIAATKRELKITIPESLDYTEVFDDLFLRYTQRHSLIRVKTTNMGSLFQLTYEIELKDQKKEKEMIDEIRCRNGNLDIICGRPVTDIAMEL